MKNKLDRKIISYLPFFLKNAETNSLKLKYLKTNNNLLSCVLHIEMLVNS